MSLLTLNSLALFQSDASKAKSEKDKGAATQQGLWNSAFKKNAPSNRNKRRTSDITSMAGIPLATRRLFVETSCAVF